MSSPLKRPASIDSPPLQHLQHHQHQQSAHHPHQQQHNFMLMENNHTSHHHHSGNTATTNYIIESTIYATSTDNGPDSPASSAPQSPVGFQHTGSLQPSHLVLSHHSSTPHQYLQRHPSYTTMAAMNGGSAGLGGGDATAAIVGGAFHHVPTGASLSPAKKPRSRAVRTKLKKKSAWMR